MKRDEIRNFIYEQIKDIVDEERIANSDADELVDRKEDFLGSHTYGENIGHLNKLYAAFSYGEQHPLFVWIEKEEFKKLRPTEAKEIFIKKDIITKPKEKDGEIKYREGVWFYNQSPYYIKNKKGEVKANKWTFKHLEQLKPNEKIQARDSEYLKKLLKDFKEKYNIGKNNHSCNNPGEK